MAMPDPGLVKRLAPLAALVFFANMAIGLPLPALPQHVHDGLGFGATIVGWAVGMQALVTILTRAPCGRQTDVRGPKWAVLVGLPGAAVAGGAYILSAQLSSQPNLSLAVLLLARAVLGVSESFFLVGAMTWGIARVGPQNTGMVMAWQGIALQASIGVGAPIGLYLQNRFGFAAVGMAAVVSPLLALLIGLAIPATPPVGHRNQGGFLQVMRQVWPQGVALALGMTPFAVLSAFVALHFAARNWGGAGFAIAAFAAGYIAVRLFFAHLPDRMGGSRVAIISLAIEAAGQLILWSATSQAVAIAGAVVSGVGFSLVFPSFGVQAMRKVPPQMRGLAVGAFLAFLDVALGLSAPLAGAVAERHGFASVFLMGALAAIAAIVVAAASRPREKAEPAGA